MENLIFVSSKRFDAATVTASSERATLPASYLQQRLVERKWRAQGCTAEYLLIDFGQARVINNVTISGHNGSSSIHFQARLASTSGGTISAPAVDTGSVSGWPSSGKPTDEDWPSYDSQLRFRNSNAYRWLRLDILDPTNTDGYFQATRIYAGQELQLTYNVDANPVLGLVPADYQRRSAYNRLSTSRRGEPARTFDLPISEINRRELNDSLFELQRYCGMSRDFFFSLDPSTTADLHKWSMPAVFTTPAQFRAQANAFDATAELWSHTITIGEQT